MKTAILLLAIFLFCGGGVAHATHTSKPKMPSNNPSLYCTSGLEYWNDLKGKRFYRFQEYVDGITSETRTSAIIKAYIPLDNGVKWSVECDLSTLGVMGRGK